MYLYKTRWHMYPNSGVLATEVARRILALAANALAEGRHFSIVLAGGSTPEAVYRLLGNATSDWSRWQIYFGDERCLPPEHQDRNSAMAAHSWLDRVPIPEANIHPIAANSGAEAAAAAYTGIVRKARPFDLVLLGMGEDGHTASLFPGQSHDPDALVVPVHKAPKPPPERVSLGFAALNDAAVVMILVTGKAKREAVRRWRNAEDLPVAHICGHNGADVYLDVEADG